MTNRPPEPGPLVISCAIGAIALLGGIFSLLPLDSSGPLMNNPLPFVLMLVAGFLGGYLGWRNYKTRLKEWKKSYEIRRRE